MPDKASDPLLAQLAQTLEKDGEQREDLIKRIKVGGCLCVGCMFKVVGLAVALGLACLRACQEQGLAAEGAGRLGASSPLPHPFPPPRPCGPGPLLPCRAWWCL